VDIAYEQSTEEWELELAALLATLWSRVGTTTTFRQFITEAADAIIAYREVAWTLADIDLARAMASSLSLEVQALGYRPHPYFLNGAVLERQLVQVLFNTGPEDLQTAARVETSAREAVDELRAKRLERVALTEVNDTWRASQGRATHIWSRTGMVDGYRRKVSAGACPWCVSLANGVWPGDAAFPTHPNDRCIRTPVSVPLDQIHERWRNGYAQRLGSRYAQEPFDDTYLRYEYDTAA
jgi:hypothetical protein